MLSRCFLYGVKPRVLTESKIFANIKIGIKESLSKIYFFCKTYAEIMLFCLSLPK